jgi:hypothetical protein
MTTKPKKPSRLDYYPILSFFFFWFFSAVVGAVRIGDPGIMKVGLFTLPAVTAMILATLIIRKNRRLHAAGPAEKKEGDHP